MSTINPQKKTDSNEIEVDYEDYEEEVSSKKLSDKLSRNND